MIKLVPAKCPSCGAQLELDDNMKRAECSFCKSTIIVDEAIEKFKTDSQGNLNVSGIKGYDQLLNEARKYFKIEKYNEAISKCNEVLELDNFNDDAGILKLKCYIALLEQDNDYEEKIKTSDDKTWDRAECVISSYSKLKDIVKANDSEEYVYRQLDNDIIEKCDKISELLKDNVNPFDIFVENHEYENKIIDLLKKYTSFDWHYRDLVCDTLYKLFSIKIDSHNILTGHTYFYIPPEGNFELHIAGEEINISNKYSSVKQLYDELKKAYDEMNVEYNAYKNLIKKLNSFIKQDGINWNSKRKNYLKDIKSRANREKYLINKMKLNTYLLKNSNLEFISMNSHSINYQYFDSYYNSTSNGCCANTLSNSEIEKIIDDYENKSFMGKLFS